MDISIERVGRLSLRMRIAWAASTVEPVLDLYSRYFRVKYHQDDALEMAWDFACGKAIDENRRRSMVKEVDDLASVADAEGYNYQQIGMATELLAEIVNDDGKSSYVAVEDAAASFACQRLYQRDLTPNDPRLRIEDIDALEEPFWVFARQTLEYAETAEESQIERGMFGRFDLPFQPVDLSKLGRTTEPSRRPPVHEQ